MAKAKVYTNIISIWIRRSMRASSNFRGDWSIKQCWKSKERKGKNSNWSKCRCKRWKTKSNKLSISKFERPPSENTKKAKSTLRMYLTELLMAFSNRSHPLTIKQLTYRIYANKLNSSDYVNNAKNTCHKSNTESTWINWMYDVNYYRKQWTVCTVMLTISTDL